MAESMRASNQHNRNFNTTRVLQHYGLEDVLVFMVGTDWLHLTLKAIATQCHTSLQFIAHAEHWGPGSHNSPISSDDATEPQPM